MSVNKHFRIFEQCHLFSPHFLFFVFLFYGYAASQRINVHIVYMHEGKEINKIICAFAFSDGFKSKSAYNKSSAPKKNKATMQSLQFSFTFDMHNIQE